MIEAYIFVSQFYPTNFNHNFCNCQLQTTTKAPLAAFPRATLPKLCFLFPEIFLNFWSPEIPVCPFGYIIAYLECLSEQRTSFVRNCPLSTTQTTSLCWACRIFSANLSIILESLFPFAISDFDCSKSLWLIVAIVDFWSSHY